MRQKFGRRQTRTYGLSDEALAPFHSDTNLTAALQQALSAEIPQTMSESDCIRKLLTDVESFYAPEYQNPYIAVASKGPWIVTLAGNVVHDNGGYGMLGLGHAPTELIDAMSQPFAMANVMTGCFEHAQFTRLLKAELGHRNHTPEPFKKFMCLNSGSEGIELALRVSDAHAKKHAHGKPKVIVALRDSFHGRTSRAGSISDSCYKKYKQHLGSFEDGSIRSRTVHVEPNDCEALERTFADLTKQEVHVEAFVAEPTQGEGSPGLNMTREYYDLVRRLTKENDSVLLLDSVQAGLRARGSLSLIDAAGFETADPPDMEVWSKAINGGQFPLSVLGLGERMVGVYPHGVYGNTMTGNPRALAVGSAVLRQCPEFRQNIVDRGEDFKAMLQVICDANEDRCSHVSGSGLLCALHMHGHFPVCGTNALEQQIRRAGVGVIHGGVNALRFTPHFRITKEEIDMVGQILSDIVSTATPAELQLEVEF